MAIPIKLLTSPVANAKAKVLKAHQLPPYDPRAKTIDQPLVTVQFAHDVQTAGQLYTAGVLYDVPLDLAHSLHTHIVK